MIFNKENLLRIINAMIKIIMLTKVTSNPILIFSNYRIKIIKIR